MGNFGDTAFPVGMLLATITRHLLAFVMGSLAFLKAMTIVNNLAFLKMPIGQGASFFAFVPNLMWISFATTRYTDRHPIIHVT